MKAYKGLLDNAHTGFNVADTAEKAFFLEVYSELKDKGGDDYKTIVTYIKQAVPEMVPQKQLTMVVNMARDYVGSKLFTRITLMRWYNIKALVSLVRYINKEHGADAVKGIKRRISAVGGEFDSVNAYNNNLAKLIVAIKSEYKVVITDDSKVLTRNVKSMYNGLTDTQKSELLALLLADTVKIQDVKEVA